MRGVRTLVAILSGNAIVLIKRDECRADVLVGKGVNKRFAINSMVGAVKAMCCKNIQKTIKQED